MKKVFVVFAFLFLFSFTFVSSLAAEVTVIDEIGSFSGAVLRVKASANGELGDKILPSEYLSSVGIVKFEIETSLPEIFLDIVISKDGMVVANLDEGPFVMNGSDILIDRREKKEMEVIKAAEVVENVSVENESVEENVVVVEEVEKEDKGMLFYLTGKVVAMKESVVSFGYPVWGGFGVLLLVVFGGVALSRRKKKKNNILSDEDKELEYMEKKVKETAEKIGKVKESKEKKARIERAKAKLMEEERELRELEERKEDKLEEKKEDEKEERDEFRGY
ncbi:MAG: hypothetical protein V1888_03930 [archaeon]